MLALMTSVRPISKFLCRFDIDILPQQNADNRPISIFLRSRADICRYHIKKSLSTQKTPKQTITIIFYQYEIYEQQKQARTSTNIPGRHLWESFFVKTGRAGPLLIYKLKRLNFASRILLRVWIEFCSLHIKKKLFSIIKF